MRAQDSSEAKTPFKDVREVMETDSWDKALTKISEGIEGQIDQARAQLKATQKSKGYLVNKHAGQGRVMH